MVDLADKNEHHDDAADASMISSARPYESTTEPVPHRREVCGGIIVDMKYIRSFPGILKVAEIFLNLLVLICLGVTGACVRSCGSVAFMKITAISGMIVGIVIYVVYSCTLQKKLSIINWPGTDLINCVIFAVCYLIASIMLAVNSEHSGDKAAIVFGFILMLVYGANAWFAYRKFVIAQHKRKSGVSHVETADDNS